MNVRMGVSQRRRRCGVVGKSEAGNAATPRAGERSRERIRKQGGEIRVTRLARDMVTRVQAGSRTRRTKENGGRPERMRTQGWNMCERRRKRTHMRD